MKKILYCTLAAAGVMSLASCSNDDMPMPAGDGVNITVKLPRDMATRGTFGDGTDAGDRAVLNNLQWSVFEVSGETKTLVFSDGRGAFGNSQTEELVNIPLAKGKTYQIAFYADDSSNGFVTYSDGDITVDYAKAASNTAAEDAFIGKSTVFTVSGAYSETVTLTRPFAQLNWGTDDTKAKVLEGIIEKMTASVKVTDGLFKNMNVLSGIATNPVSGDVAFNAVNLSKLPTQAFPVKKTDATQEPYALIAMNYLLTGNGVIDCELTLNEGLAPVVVNAAPVQVNHRTNIYGSLLTAPGEFNIIVDNNFTPEDNNITEWAGTEEELAALIAKGGSVIIKNPVNEIDLTDYAAGKPLQLILNANVGKIYVKDFATTSPVTVTVGKGVEYPVFGNKTHTGLNGGASPVENFTLEGDLDSSVACGQIVLYSMGSGTKNVTIRNIRFDGSKIDARNGSAIINDRYTNENLVVSGCVFENMNYPGVYITKNVADTGSNMDPSQSVTVENCTVSFAPTAVSSTNGFYLLQINDIKVKGNTVTNSPYHGIFARAFNSAEVTGNTIVNATKDGIKIETDWTGYSANCKSVTVTDNSVQAVENGIRVKATVFPTATVTGNKIDMSKTVAYSGGEPCGILLVGKDAASTALINVFGNIKNGDSAAGNDHWFEYSGFTPSAESNFANPF